MQTLKLRSIRLFAAPFFDKYPAANVSFGIHGCQCKQALRRWYDLIFSDIFTSSLLSDFNRFFLCKLEVTFAIDQSFSLVLM